MTELKNETGVRFSYSEEQLKTIFASVNGNKNNLLGKGGSGEVYTDNDGRLAFKIMCHESAFKEDVRGNEALEAGIENFSWKKEVFYRQSEGFVTEYIGAFEQDGQRIVVFERIKGKDFSKYIEEKRKIEQQQPLNTAFAEKQLRKDCIILSQMATAVAAVHESGCINRDIKPQNAMISVRTTAEPERDEAGNVIRNDNGEIRMKQTEVPYVKLIDQGTVIDLKEGKPLSDIPIGGTFDYMPKEFVDEKPISPASDIHALGISIMETVCTDIGPFKNMPGANDNETLFGKNLPNAIKQCFGDKMPFLRDLVLKCCSFKPEDRPSAAQVAYCLEFYTSVIGTEAEKSLKFDEVLKMAEADRPKGIPLALRDMMQSEDNAVQQKGCQAVLNLCDADPSYKKTPSYGLALLRTDQQKFETWASDNKDTFQTLKDRIYTGEKPQNEGGMWSEKDIKVSQDEFNAINNLFPNENANPKNIA